MRFAKNSTVRFDFYLLSFFLFLTNCLAQSQVLTGLDQIDDYHFLFAQKNVGIITNHTAVNRKGQHIVDVFLKLPEVSVVALFGPEHGVRGETAAGEPIYSQTDSLIPIYSLYGATRKPTADMLSNVDVLVFDIQDIGARFYTYIWTMFYAMQAAAENNIPFVVLDRPNPITGRVEGAVLDKKYASFIGLLPIPVRHGLTVGELARLFNGQGWLGENLKLDLKIIPLQNWSRDMWFDETGLNFIPPSPNMPSLETAIFYPGACLLEGTNVSEGRGTERPFLLFGAPWINGDLLCEKLNSLSVAGIHFEPAEFTPIAMPGKSLQPKYKNEKCYGARIHITNRDDVESFLAGVIIVKTLHDLYPESFKFRQDGFFDKLCGTDKIRAAIQTGQNVRTMQEMWLPEVETYKSLSAMYFIYP